MVKSYVKKVISKAKKAMKKRYVTKSNRGLRVSKIMSDLTMLKSMVNAEKEIYTAYATNNAQVAPTGSLLQAVTNVAEGTSQGQRDGESIKLHGFRINLRYQQQTSTTNPQYVKFWLVKYIGPRGSAPDISTFLKPDFDGYYSASSERNEDHYKSYQIITHDKSYIKSDQITGQSQYVLKSLYGRFKGATHQRYSGAAATTLLTDQMYIICVASNGTNAASTGILLDCQALFSFYDN